MSPPLAPLDPNVPATTTKPRHRSKSDTLPRPSAPSADDDEIWNLTQRVAHLEAPLDQANASNVALASELARLEGVEDALDRQRAANRPLAQTYQGIRADEDARLYAEDDE
jgi:hypothetical protein